MKPDKRLATFSKMAMQLSPFLLCNFRYFYYVHIATSDGHVCGTKRTECVVNGHMADQSFDLLVCHPAQPELRVNGAYFAGFPFTIDT